MYLARIRDEAAKFGKVISRILCVDVLIVDSNLKPVSNTYLYFSKYDLIKKLSLIGSVISEGKVIALADKSDFIACQKCDDYVICPIEGFLGVPIFYNGVVVGAIALILPKQRVAQIFKELLSSTEFLERMADLLSMKIRSYDEYSTLNIIRKERELLMDAVDYAMVTVDVLGYITYHNKIFSGYFGENKDLIGNMIQEVLQHKEIEKAVDKQEVFENKLIRINRLDKSFYGFAFCEKIMIESSCTGLIFTFKPIEQKSSYENTSLNSFLLEIEDYFQSSVIERAKSLAISSEPVLIQCCKGAKEDVLVQFIHKFSDRNKRKLYRIDCKNITTESLAQNLFGEIGTVYLAQYSSLCIKNIEYMPIFLQKKLVEIMQNMNSGFSPQNPVKFDIRLIFTCNSNIDYLLKKGCICEELFYRITTHTIMLNKGSEDKLFLEQVIEKSFNKFKRLYGKESAKLSLKIKEILLEYDWQGNLDEIDLVMDKVAFQSTEGIQLAEEFITVLLEKNVYDSAKQTIKEVEKEKIASLLRDNVSRECIAKTLGLSRTTLYRKIKKYNL